MRGYNLENVVNHRVSILAVLMKRHVLKMLDQRKLAVTPEQWVIMYYLWQENGLSIGEIARRSKKDFANVTRIVEKLEKLGYVAKRKSKKDGRIYNVFILDQANEIREDIQDCWNEASDVALQGISPSEQTQLMDILEKIERNILKNLDEEFGSGKN